MDVFLGGNLGGGGGFVDGFVDCLLRIMTGGGSTAPLLGPSGSLPMPLLPEKVEVLWIGRFVVLLR